MFTIEEPYGKIGLEFGHIERRENCTACNKDLQVTSVPPAEMKTRSGHSTNTALLEYTRYQSEETHKRTSAALTPPEPPLGGQCPVATL